MLSVAHEYKFLTEMLGPRSLARLASITSLKAPSRLCNLPDLDRLLFTASTGHQEAFLGSDLPRSVTIVEVGPRDGLQNEKEAIPTSTKVELIDRLGRAGLSVIEATSFVSPKWVPQLADSAEVLQQIPKRPNVRYTVLTPNLKGLQRAITAGAQEVAIFAAASETFSLRNINCGIAESLKRFEEVADAAKDAHIAIRGYVSCAVGCPYEGAVAPAAAAGVAARLMELGCYEVSMGDTNGVGTPATVAAMFKECAKAIPVNALAAHMHDTYGQGCSNVLTALQMGISTIDSSIAGLGGCPYSPGASGNVATEDVVYMLSGFGIQHGVDLDALVDTSAFICKVLGKTLGSHVAQAVLGARQRQNAMAA